MAWLIQLSGDFVTTHEVADGAVVGRDGDVSVQIADPLVSKRHAQLFRRSDGQWMIVDLGSRYGTFVAKRALSQALLPHGMEVIIGCTRFVFQEELDHSQLLNAAADLRRRRHERVTCALDVEVRLADGSRHSATALDISLGGIRLDFTTEVELDATLDLSIRLPKRWRRFRTAAQVIRIGEGETGLIFKGVTRRQTRCLARYIHRFMLETPSEANRKDLETAA